MTEPIHTGRLGELQDLASAALRRRSLTLLEIAGESGSGRSHVLALLRPRLEDLGFQVIDAPAHGGRGSAWRSLPDLAATLAYGLSPEAAEALDTVVRDALRQTDRATALFADVSLTAREPALARAMEERLGDRPTAFLVDDAHLAERVMLRFLAKVVAVAPPAPRLVVAAADPSRGIDLAYPGTVHRERVALQPLGVEEIEALLLSFGVPGPVAGSGARELHRHLLRHPRPVRLAALELRQGSGLDALDALASAGLRGLLARRVSRLAGLERELLEVASISGSGISYWRLKRLGVADDLALPELQRLTDGLESQGVLRRIYPRGKLRMVFQEPDERLLIYESMEEEKRRLLHRSFASVLQEEDLDPEDRHSEAGRHLLLSGDEVAGTAELLLAGGCLLGRGRVEEARRHFQEVSRRARRTRLLAAEGVLADEGLGDIEILAGTVSEAAECYARARKAADVLDPGSRARLLRKVARCRLREGHLEEVEPLVVEGFAAAGDDFPQERAHLTDVLASLAHRRGDLAGALVIGQRALLAAQACKDDAVTATVYRTLGTVRIDQGAVHAAVEDLEAARVLCERQGDARGYAGVCLLLGIALAQLGGHEEAAARYREALRIYEVLSNLSGMAAALNNLATIHMGTDELELALRELAEAERLQQKLGDSRSVAISMANQAAISFTLGRLEESLQKTEETLIFAGKGTNVNVEMAVSSIRSAVLHRLGRLSEALATARDLVELARSTGHTPRLLWGHLAEAEVLSTLGSFEEAESVVLHALRVAQESGVTDVERSCLGQLVELARLRGDAEGARAHLDDLRTRLGARSEAESRDFEVAEMEVAALTGPLPSPSLSRLQALAGGGRAPFRLRASLLLAVMLPAADAFAHAVVAHELAREAGDAEQHWRAALRRGEVERERGMPEAASHLEEAARRILSVAADLPEEDRALYLGSHGRRRVLVHARRLE